MWPIVTNISTFNSIARSYNTVQGINVGPLPISGMKILFHVSKMDSSTAVNHDHLYSLWSKLIQWIRVILSGDKLT